MEKYLTAADRVARAAMFGPPAMTPTLIRLRSDGRRNGDARTFPAQYDRTGLSLPNAFHAMHRLPVEADYVIRVGLGGSRPLGSDPITLTLWVDNRQVDSLVYDAEKAASFDQDRQDFNANTRQFRVRLPAGEHQISVAIPNIYDGFPPRFGGPNPATRPQPPRAGVHAAARRHARTNRPAAAAVRRRAGGDPEASPERRTREHGRRRRTVRADRRPVAREHGEDLCRAATQSGQHADVCVPQILTGLARRAFRRPVTEKEVAKYVTLVRQAQKDEGSFDEGLVVGVQALLVSPDFLFRIERSRPAPAGAVAQRITQHELATRLSYFLWATMPDEPLRRAADAGTLRDPVVLAAQVRRMLRDPRSRSIAEQFGGQWLQFRGLESLTRNRERFPDFEDYLRLSMRRETELFVDYIVREDRSILDFIGGRYSFLNERLARHYGIAGVSGPEFRRVDLTGTPRGGVLTQGSVLTVSSYATRTSPVLRGKWILDNLLDAPPPDPPADVPNLEEGAIGTAATVRQQLEAHRKDPICASCHRKMDPLGFGLENFDAVGAWRTMDGKFPIDARGFLPDGDEFTGPEELRGILTKQHEAFSRAITSKLLTYALGRGLERYDTPTVKKIAGRLPARNYRFSALVLEIVNSLPFQSRRPAPQPVTTTAAKRGTP